MRERTRTRERRKIGNNRGEQQKPKKERMQYRVEFLEVVQEGEHASNGRGEKGERKGNMDLREK